MSWQVGLGVAVLVALGLAVAGRWLWVRRAARRPRVYRPPRLRHPIVLAHGILGFDEVKLAGRRQEYFRGIPDQLRKLGTEVFVLKVPALGSVEARAQALAAAVRSLPAERVNIIAHSMGGLDARFAISQLGLAARVASLTTVGTPHHGTPLADIGTRVLGDGLMLKRVLARLGVDVEAFYDLTTARMNRFNDAVPNHLKVAYGSYVARVPSAPRLNPLLLPAHLYLRQRAGDNDGLVPTDSQQWGELLGRVEADHWAQIGWSTGRFDVSDFYAKVVRDLIGRGF